MPDVLIQVVLALVIVGIVLWGLSQLPIDPAIAKFIRVAIIVFVAIWLVYILAGLLGGPVHVLRR
jgi:uncharacterized membrane protein YwzB